MTEKRMKEIARYLYPGYDWHQKPNHDRIIIAIEIALKEEYGTTKKNTR